MAKEYLHLSEEILDLACKIKNGIIWAYLCSRDEQLSVDEITSHYKLSLTKTKVALQALIKINAVFSEIANGKTFYKANPETYFHSDEI